MEEVVFVIRNSVEDKMDELILQIPKFKQTNKNPQTQHKSVIRQRRNIRKVFFFFCHLNIRKVIIHL